MEKHIYNKTKFVICDVSKCNNFDNSNKFKIWILLNIDPHNFESVTITNNNDELFVLSNGKTIILNEKLLSNNICYNETNESHDIYDYFIMKQDEFEHMYDDFEDKLNKLLHVGFTFNQIRYLFNEFTQEIINIL